ncbi:magnesium-translocating P-type ATPase [Ectothiorhodospira shaposhnikovii]|uniref:magnesium-translocating P-type ATPase n=1 Tax=Ectothiorhodospira shaposhnikovii TaxID=1054 RepID=UPI001EE9A124|nr:magnesium-translocating P-type ATPase [Ectothiorhodospira shaposhnikovii]MCG5512723.1 magnesium-translocating P-type ATPase [Ectothiorhodospira shaposhnikovii]
MARHPPDEEDAYWSREIGQLFREFGSSWQGLSPEVAAERMDRTLQHPLSRDSTPSAWRIFARQFRSPLILILAFGALVSLLVHDWVEAAIILAIVLGSALLGFIQEFRASTALATLRQRLALTTQVLRDGQALTVPVDRVVPGDVVLLSAGNLVPADGVILEARDFLVAEAGLTGESFPVEKRPGITAALTPLAQRTNCAYLGSSVRSGTARMLVTRTGADTAFGAIAERLAERPPETAFSRGVRHFGFVLVRIMIVMVVFVMTVNHLLERPAIESLLFAVALAVGITPELLPAIITVTLSHGARAMSRRGVIVRHLESIENLGNIDVLCTDKTGTLTQGVITLSEAVDHAGRPSREVRRLAYLNAALETGIDNPLDAAILKACADAPPPIESHRKIDEIPYDFSRRRLTVVITDDDSPSRHLIVTKGAFANILDICTTISRDGIPHPLNVAERTRLIAWFEARGTEGYRVLALATRLVTARPRYTRDDEKDMTLRGFLLFLDPPRTDAAETLETLASLGIQVKVITGDNRHVTAHLADSLRLPSKTMITGAELAGMRDEALWQQARAVDLFVEVDPQQKERIVRALQHTGHSVAYLGDGINDAPALHAADVGISVEGAVDVARESADVILLEPDLKVLRQGVMEGRRTFTNTLKYIGITTSANFGNMLSMALITPLLPFLPLLAKQILLNNFLSDLPSVAISTDRVDAVDMERPQHWDMRRLRRFMLMFGSVSTIFDLITFMILLKVFEAGESTFHTAWFVVSLITELAVVMVLRTRLAAWRSPPSRVLLGTTVFVFLAALTIPYLGPVAALFGFVPLPGLILATMLLVCAGYIVATEAAKRWIFFR